MVKPNSEHIRRTTWAVTGLEIGAVLFAGGLTLLYLNPFWHFDESGFLDWRVHWWNAAAEIMTAAGLLISALSLIFSLAVIVSRFASRRSWPYFMAGLLVVGTFLWFAPEGFIRDLDAHFDWNSAEGFTDFRLQSWDQGANAWRPVENSALRWSVETQLQPLLQNYFRLNDWQKMNGDVNVKVARIIPVAWPVALGSGGETLEDPDQTALMRAAAQGDTRSAKQLLASAGHVSVNALDQAGQSALILACKNPEISPDMVKALIAAGADVNLRSRNGYTALTWAIARKNKDVSQLLRKAGGRP